MIKVVSQNTSERNQEIKNNFNLIKPYLDKGYSYIGACLEVGLANHRSYSSTGLFRDLKEYGETQGYPYKEYRYPKSIGGKSNG